MEIIILEADHDKNNSISTISERRLKQIMLNLKLWEA